MIAGKVKSGDKILVEVDKDGNPVFVINGKKDEPKSEKKEKK
jgi:hypothetical protein